MDFRDKFYMVLGVVACAIAILFAVLIIWGLL